MSKKKEQPPILKNVEFKKLNKKHPEIYIGFRNYTHLLFVEASIFPIDILNITKVQLFMNDTITYAQYREIDNDFALFCAHKFIIEYPFLRVYNSKV